MNDLLFKAHRSVYMQTRRENIRMGKVNKCMQWMLKEGVPEHVAQKVVSLSSIRMINDLINEPGRS